MTTNQSLTQIPRYLKSDYMQGISHHATIKPLKLLYIVNNHSRRVSSPKNITLCIKEFPGIHTRNNNIF